MRYIIVNERRPKGLPRYCALCAAPIDSSYLREIATRIIYCGVGCYTEHVHNALVCLGALDAPMKFLTYRKGGLR